MSSNELKNYIVVYSYNHDGVNKMLRTQAESEQSAIDKTDRYLRENHQIDYTMHLAVEEPTE